MLTDTKRKQRIQKKRKVYPVAVGISDGMRVYCCCEEKKGHVVIEVNSVKKRLWICLKFGKTGGTGGMGIDRYRETEYRILD